MGQVLTANLLIAQHFSPFDALSTNQGVVGSNPAGRTTLLQEIRHLREIVGAFFLLRFLFRALTGGCPQRCQNASTFSSRRSASR